MPGGATSNKTKALNALKKQLYAQIAQQAEGQAGGVLSDAEGAGGVLVSQANVGLTRANLYGGAGDFAGAGKNLLGALNNEAGGIQAALRDPNLSYSDRLHGEQRINEIASQRIQVPAEIAGATFRRNLLGADVAAGQSGYQYNVAGAYGSDAQLGATALGESTPSRVLSPPPTAPCLTRTSPSRTGPPQNNALRALKTPSYS